jgi:hypothetical protein
MASGYRYCFLSPCGVCHAAHSRLVLVFAYKLMPIVIKLTGDKIEQRVNRLRAQCSHIIIILFHAVVGNDGRSCDDITFCKEKGRENFSP